MSPLGPLHALGASTRGGNGRWTPEVVKMHQVSWADLCASTDYRGRWVALDDCRYDEGTAKPVLGTLVDVDEDLVELCNRVRDADCHNCAILFVEN